MAKKKSSNYVSKGERPNVKKKTRNMRVRSNVQKALDQQRAFRRGNTDPWVTVENPIKTQTNRPFVKVRFSELRLNSKVHKDTLQKGLKSLKKMKSLVG